MSMCVFLSMQPFSAPRRNSFCCLVTDAVASQNPCSDAFASGGGCFFCRVSTTGHGSYWKYDGVLGCSWNFFCNSLARSLRVLPFELTCAHQHVPKGVCTDPRAFAFVSHVQSNLRVTRPLFVELFVAPSECPVFLRSSCAVVWCNFENNILRRNFEKNYLNLSCKCVPRARCRNRGR